MKTFAAFSLLLLCACGSTSASSNGTEDTGGTNTVLSTEVSGPYRILHMGAYSSNTFAGSRETASVSVDENGSLNEWRKSTKERQIRGTAKAEDSYADEFVHVTRWTDGNIEGTGNDTKSGHLSTKNGEHFGILLSEPTVETLGDATYSLVHSTRPTAEGEDATDLGTVPSALFSVTSQKDDSVVLTLKVTVESPEGTLSSGFDQAFTFNSEKRAGVFGAISGVAQDCGEAACNASFAVSFAGPNAERAVVVYLLPAKNRSGALVFSRD